MQLFPVLILTVMVGSNQQTLGGFSDNGLYFQPDEIIAEDLDDRRLDECALLLDEIIARFESDTAVLSELDFHDFFIKMDNLEINIQDVGFGRFQGLMERGRELYSEFLSRSYLYLNDFLPTDAETVDSLDLEPSTDTASVVNLDSLIQEYHPLPPIELVRNRSVDNAIKFFTSRGRKMVQVWLDRAAMVAPQMLPIIRRQGMPEELLYLAMIESGFNTRAYSWAHAAGPWQFIAATGRRYGLKIDWWYDERRDIEKSTIAAMAYLRELYGRFNNWELAMAAYNCGEIKVERHLRKYGGDFWNLQRLPRQTRNYVPSFMAAAIIASDPEKYGFNPPRFVGPEPVDTVLIKECVDLKTLADCACVDVNKLRSLNPALIRWCTPPDREVTVKLPSGAVSNGFWEQYADIPPDKKVTYTRHIIRPGEALGTIAKRYGVPISVILKHPANNISNPHRIRAGQMLIIPGGGGLGNDGADKDLYDYVQTHDKYHRVKRGETLSGIAARYGISLNKLRQLNNLWGKSLIRPGQLLRIEDNSSDARSEAQLADEGIYTVRKGDSLWKIAQRLGITVEALRRTNDLHSPNLLKPGQRLAIPTNN